MKLSKKMVLMVFAVIFMSSGTALAADATAAVDFYSAYVWRGITFNDGLVMQPSIDVAAGGFGINVWGNYDLDDYNNTLDSSEFSELDITLSYSHSFGPVDLSGGYINYQFPNNGCTPATQEVYLDVAGTFLESFSAGLTGYYDFDEVKDYYLNPYLGWGMAMDALSIDLGASIGYVGGGASASGDAGFHEYTVTCDFGYSFNDLVSAGAYLAYTNTLDKDVLPEQDVDFYGGLGVAFAF